MFAGSSKLGRGAAPRGGRSGGPNRFPAPPLKPNHRPSLSLSGGPRNRNNPSPAPAAAAAAPSVDETFSLVPGNAPPAFAMILRLTPDLVEEIRRVEAQGETAKIKFDANPKNPSGNLINVGGKEFRFTWSRECGDLCDIYEEKKSGEDGNGLLVESGCAWRKLNVQRILDESTTNHVKMLSEEAERKNKSRKAIVLEPGNPSKSQIKQLAAVEATTWRMGFKKKEPPPKRRKVEPPNVSSSSFLKSTHKPGLSTNPKTTGKGIRAISPVISTPDPFQASASPSAAVNISKGNTFTDDFGPAGQMNKEETTSEREIPTKASGKVNLGSQPTDLQSMLVSLLRDNPKGLGIKALEKAIGYAIPSFGKKILSRIADYKAPGRYLLKPGVELDGFKGSTPGSGSSFEDSHKPTFEENYNGTPVPEPTLSKEEAPYSGLGQVGSAAEADLDMSENVDIEGNSPDIFGDKKDFDNLGGRAHNSGSDSDNSSSDSQSGSGSPRRSRSRSRSRSKSPVGSGSGSSSGSESYSSSDQEGSDEDVDIMTSDDDKSPKHNLQESQPTIPASTTDGGIVDIDGVDEKNDGHESDIVDIDAVEEGDYGHGATAADMDGVSPGQNVLRERQNFIGSSFDLEETAPEENFKKEKLDSSGRISRGKKVSRYDSNNLDVKTEHSKRLKKGSYLQPVIPRVDNGRYSLSPYDSLPDRHNEDILHSPACMVNPANQDANAQFSMQKGNRAIHEKPILHSQQPSRRSYDQGFSGSLTNDVSGRPNKQVENSSHVRLLPQKDKSVREAQSDALNPAERGPRRKKEGSGKRFQTSDSPYDKSRETVGNNPKVVAETYNVQVESSRNDTYGSGVEIPAHAGGRGVATLPRELLGLEMGELRPEEALVKRPSERKGPMKQSEYKSSNIERRSTDLGEGKIPAKLSIESGKPSTPNLSRRRTVEHREDEQAVPMPPGIQSQPLNPLEGDRGDDSAQISKKVNISKSARNGPLQLDAMRGKTKESKTQAVDIHTNLSNGQKEAVSADCGVGLRWRESSSDENSCSYSKYEKDAPELKGRIKDFSQFEEYVQEYRDKYENYCSINKILENYRNKFQKMGRELEVAKARGTERYNQALEQLRDSYRKYGVKHKRLKKIFVVLHQELKHLKQMMNDFAQSQSKD